MFDAKTIALAIVLGLLIGFIAFGLTGCEAYNAGVKARQFGYDGKTGVSYRVEYAR